MEWLLLGFGAMLAGFIDAAVGGGGLVQIPLLFNTLPNTAPATIFGTNKFSSIFGTLSATMRYMRRVVVPWKLVLPAAAMAFVFSFVGAAAVSYFPPELLKPLVLVLLVLVSVYTLIKKDFGVSGHRVEHGARDVWVATLFGGVIGFYDGFFGPGTGSFLIFLFIRFIGMDFLHASASSKVVNATTNLAALLYFGTHGHILWKTAAIMAVCNVIGAQLGSGMAIKHGAKFVRILFLLVVGVMICRFGWDTLIAR
ncbi:MAG: hypothetical protein RIR70_34 [Pseudomonadota bacterium]|jgi:uncharacterized membrane protein YfcA